MTTSTSMDGGAATSASEQIARRAKAAFERANQTLGEGAEADEKRAKALHAIREALEANADKIRVANREDVEAAAADVKAGKLSSSLASRLDLFSKPGKWESTLSGITDVASLPSPLGRCTYSKRLAAASGSVGALDLYRLSCPIGVLLCIFEARPEVIVNIASLAIKSGNAAILKGGKESRRTAAVMADVLASALARTELPPDIVQTVHTREEVGQLLEQDRYIDLVVPRGSGELVRSIQRDARMPVMGHADGICAAYVHEDAQLDMTIGTIIDSKTDYPAACNAVETLLLHRSHLTSNLWPTLASSLVSCGVRLHCDPASLAALQSSVPSAAQHAQAAVAEDWDTEFLDLTLAVKTVSGVTEAIDHINAHGSHHTDVILTGALGPGEGDAPPSSAAALFTRSLSSANVFVNCSTRFADGFRYGFGAEVGISTGRTHARGPVGLEGLVIYKYVARGEGAQPHRAADFTAPAQGEAPNRSWAHEDIAPKSDPMA